MKSLFQVLSSLVEIRASQVCYTMPLVNREVLYGKRFISFLLFVFFAILLNTNAYSQTINYSYDNSGNRIAKQYLPSFTRGNITDEYGPDETLTDFGSNIFFTVENNTITVFVIDFEETINCNIILYSSDGRIIKSLLMDAPVATLMTGNLSKGVYVLCITINNKKQVWKFTKE